MLISCSSCPLMEAGTDLEWLTQPNGLLFFSPTTQVCMFSLSWPHYITSTNLGYNLTWNNAQTPDSQQLFGASPFHSFLSSSLCLLLPSVLLLFSLLNCKYQVPFILFCYFLLLLLLYCCYCNFFFSSRPVQQRPDCLSSVAVCKYNFISVPGSGGEKQNKMFHFYSLSLNFSLHDFPFSP